MGSDRGLILDLSEAFMFIQNVKHSYQNIYVIFGTNEATDTARDVDASTLTEYVFDSCCGGE